MQPLARGRGAAACPARRRDQAAVAAGVQVEAVTERDATEIARLRRMDTDEVLSLGDRCCLALGRRLSSDVLTAERAWSTVDTGVEVRQVR